MVFDNAKTDTVGDRMSQDYTIPNPNPNYEILERKSFQMTTHDINM